MVLHGGQSQPGFLKKLPDGSLPGVLSGLHQSGGQLIDKPAHRVAVLPDEDDPALIICRKDHNAIGVVFLCGGFQAGRVPDSGSHIVVKVRSVPLNGIHLVQGKIFAACELANGSNLRHGVASFCNLSVSYHTSLRRKKQSPQGAALAFLRDLR